MIAFNRYQAFAFITLFSIVVSASDSGSLGRNDRALLARRDEFLMDALLYRLERRVNTTPPPANAPTRPRSRANSVTQAGPLAQNQPVSEPYPPSGNANSGTPPAPASNAPRPTLKGLANMVKAAGRFSKGAVLTTADGVATNPGKTLAETAAYGLGAAVAAGSGKIKDETAAVGASIVVAQKANERGSAAQKDVPQGQPPKKPGQPAQEAITGGAKNLAAIWRGGRPPTPDLESGRRNSRRSLMRRELYYQAAMELAARHFEKIDAEDYFEMDY